MREIKYKAWDMKKKEWVIKPTTLQDLVAEEYYPADWVDKVIWVEYTGLKDKNGKPIFEGDVLSPNTEDDKSKLEVRFEEGAFVTSFGTNIKEVSKLCEVIGNIYENKDLLNDTT